MRLGEYLATLSDKEQDAFVERTRAIGSPTVDVFSATKPKEYDDQRDSLDVDHIHAIHFHDGSGSSKHYHLLLLDYQYAYWADPERRPKVGWLVAASKANTAWSKATTKSDSSVEQGPRHVYGSSIFDPDTKERIFPGTRKKQPIEVGSIGVRNDDN